MAVTRKARDLPVRAGAASFILPIQKLLRSLLDGVLEVLATIGWLVTLPLNSKRPSTGSMNSEVGGCRA